MAEELLLHRHAVGRIEVRPVRIAVHLEPLLLARGVEVALDVAARMQALAAPVAIREERHLDFGIVGRARAPELVVELVLEREAAEIEAVGMQHLVGRRFRTADPVAGHRASEAARTEAVLHALHLHVVPIGEEGAEDAAVTAHLAVPVVRALPRADRGQMLRLQRCHLPRVHRVIGDAVDAHLATGPRLHARPVDALREVLRLARSPQLDVPRRAAAATRIHAHARVAFRHPLLRVDDLPVLVTVARAGRHFRMLRDHLVPAGLVELLEVQPLRVRAVGDDHGILALGDRPIDVAAKHDAIVHRDRYVPVDSHPVANLGFHFAAHVASSSRSAAIVIRGRRTRRAAVRNARLRA